MLILFDLAGFVFAKEKSINYIFVALCNQFFFIVLMDRWIEIPFGLLRRKTNLNTKFFDLFFDIYYTFLIYEFSKNVRQ